MRIFVTMKNWVVYRKTFLLGDIHGTWSAILNHLNRIDEDQICYIQVGDFAIGYNPVDYEMKKLKILDEELRKKNSDLFIIRGNHDNPEWFRQGQFDQYKAELTNIFFIPDYTVLNINLENILFVGGAVSIDRVYSKMTGRKWWEDEVVKFDFDKVKDLLDIDRMVCHTAPDFVEPLTFNQLVYNYAKQDDLLLADLRNERANMTKLVTDVMSNNKLKGYYYGHFHNHYRFYHRDCEFIGLSVNQFIQL